MRCPHGLTAAGSLLVLLTACTTPSMQEPTTTPAPPNPSVTPASAAPLITCDEPTEDIYGTGARGEAGGGSLVALAFHRLTANTEIKIVFRVTGTGEARFSATGPDGATVTPAWTEEHSGSTFRYPGDEWGTGFRFPSNGCWTVHVQRDDLTASLELPIS